jgi:hypothetical protein
MEFCALRQSPGSFQRVAAASQPLTSRDTPLRPAAGLAQEFPIYLYVHGETKRMEISQLDDPKLFSESFCHDPTVMSDLPGHGVAVSDSFIPRSSLHELVLQNEECGNREKASVFEFSR